MQSTTTELASGTWMMDPARTTIRFANKKMMVWTVRGTFDLKEGVIEAADPVSDTRIRVVVDATSFKTPTSMRDKHVKRVLDVENYPDIVFESTGVRETGAGWEVNGNLTVKDQTHPLTLDVRPSGSSASDRLGFELSTVLSKKQFGVGVMAPMVADDIQIEIDGEASLAGS